MILGDRLDRAPERALSILVLGASGFVGGAVVGALLARGHRVEAWSRRPRAFPVGVLAREADLLHPPSYAHFRGPWDALVHLAAHAVPNAAFTEDMARENVVVTRHALEHLRATSPGARFVLGSSAAVYAPSELALGEDAPVGPRGLYARSKLDAEELARTFGRDLDLRVARLFNQIGPGMPAGLALSDLCAALARGDDPVRMKGADSTRDYHDVRDGARALVLLCETEHAGTWNVASGVPRRISELARDLVERLGTRQRIEFAPATPDTVLGARTKLERELGWGARVPFEETLDRLARWTAELRAENAPPRPR
ncbi:MAG: NAD(P)-dependent oxidoreductase [Planctomycetes bacterium]|nr:NAD(P)-dependent oxidoreductase [Planctomycetota bacterium]